MATFAAFFEGISMNKWKIFACISLITLMSVLVGANFFALYSTVLNENNVAEETQSADFIYQHPDNIPSKTLDFLIANRQADIPQKILFIQTQKNLDGKFFLPVFSFGQDFISRSPTHLGLVCPVYSTHPYTQLDKFYYLYTLKKILI